MENYSQKQLIALFKEGAFSEEVGVPKHIETVISNVFLFEKNVYKFYKNDVDFFNKNFRDISSKEERFLFTERDFNWNQILSPEIYLHQSYVSVKNGTITEAQAKEDAEEVVMVMNRIDSHDVLFEKLTAGIINESDCFAMGRQLGESMKKVQVPPLHREDFFRMFERRIKDLREWIVLMSQYFNDGEIDAYCSFLEDFRIRNKEWFETTLSDAVTADGDFHSQNAVYSGGKLSLMDTYPPKEEWGLGHRHIVLYRIGVDIWGLTGRRDFFEAFVRGYEEGNGMTVDRKLDQVFVVYVAGIAVSYLHMLRQSDPTKEEPARKFHAFLREYFSSIV